MPSRRAAVLALVAAALGGACLPPEWGAGAILHPTRRPVWRTPDLPHEVIAFRSQEARLEGWLFRGRGSRRGLVVYLHGVADNRQSGIGVAQRLVPLGWDVLAYDARAHGRSEGSACTYGYLEKRDVTAALEAVGADHAVLFGSSLGAAVALQAASVEPRVRGVIAQSTFSDLRSIVADRAPRFATAREVERSLELAERRAGFRVDEASPLAAARRIMVPVFLVHGADDRETRPVHSQRVFEALEGPKRLLLVPGAGHNDVLAREDVWTTILDWLEALPAQPAYGAAPARLN
jgi:pimeloyl-ACP methyl ester carboxylesterase